MNSLPKFVASRTLEEPLGWNATLLKGDAVEEVGEAEAAVRSGLLIYGLGQLVNTLM
jgi:hypothetical protein